MADLSEVHSVNFFENMMQNAAIEMTLHTRATPLPGNQVATPKLLSNMSSGVPAPSLGH